MNNIINLLRTAAFWGIVFFLFLLLGFNIPYTAFLETAFSNSFYLNYICIYMLVSIIAWPLLEMINIFQLKRRGSTFVEYLAIALPPLL